MPSKHENLSDLTARNRVNQRNFRNRKQQYTKDLEAKVRAYEEREIGATVAVQAAARRVVEENDALKEILQRELGLSHDQINERVISLIGLRQYPVQQVSISGSIPMTREVEHMGKLGQDSPSIALANDQSPMEYIDSFVATSVPFSSTITTMNEAVVQERGTHMRPTFSWLPPGIRPLQPELPAGQAGAESEAESEAVQVPTTSLKINAEDVQSIEGESPEEQMGDDMIDPQLEGLARANGMTCEEAAEIMTSIKFNASIEDAREQLGCSPGGQSCRVGHAKLFDLLNESMR